MPGKLASSASMPQEQEAGDHLPPILDDAQSDLEELEDEWDEPDGEVIVVHSPANNNKTKGHLPKEGAGDLEVSTKPTVGTDEDDLEAMPKAGNLHAPAKETEPSSDPDYPVKHHNTRSKGPKTLQIHHEMTVGGMVDVPSRTLRRIRRLTQKAEQIQ